METNLSVRHKLLAETFMEMSVSGQPHTLDCETLQALSRMHTMMQEQARKLETIAATLMDRDLITDEITFMHQWIDRLNNISRFLDSGSYELSPQPTPDCGTDIRLAVKLAIGPENDRQLRDADDKIADIGGRS